MTKPDPGQNARNLIIEALGLLRRATVECPQIAMFVRDTYPGEVFVEITDGEVTWHRGKDACVANGTDPLSDTMVYTKIARAIIQDEVTKP